MARAFLLAGLAAVALSGCANSKPARSASSDLNDRTTVAGSHFQGIGVTPPWPRPSFTLTDATGKSFSFAQRTAGRPTLLYFGYTNCPDVCPETMADISLALKTLPQAIQRKTFVVFVSTDVKHDTGPTIAAWLKNFAPNTTATFVGLRGTQAQIDAAQTVAHVAVAADNGQTHSALVLLYGVDDYARVSYAQSTTEQQQIAHDVPLVAGS